MGRETRPIHRKPDHHLHHRTPSDAHLHLEFAVRLVALDPEVIRPEAVDPALPELLDRPLPHELGERPRRPGALHAERVDVVPVDVGVAHLEDELVRLGVRDERDHVREERIGRDVEGDTEPEVTRALVHQAGEEGLGRGSRRVGEGDVELAEHVAGRKGHNAEVCAERAVSDRTEEKGTSGLG